MKQNDIRSTASDKEVVQNVLKKLFSELEEGETSAKKEGWISIEEAEKSLGL